jgi:hypothetical protein
MRGPTGQPLHQRRGPVGQAHGHPTMWSADGPPPPLSFDVVSPHWLLTSVQGRTCSFHGRGEGGSPLYIWGKGLNFKTWEESLNTQHLKKHSQDVVFTFSCRGLRTSGVHVWVIVRGLRVFVKSPVCLLPSLYVMFWVCTRVYLFIQYFGSYAFACVYDPSLEPCLICLIHMLV